MKDFFFLPNHFTASHFYYSPFPLSRSKLPSLILDISTLALFNCRAVCSAGRSWRKREGSCRIVGVAGDCITGETVELDAELAGLVALSPDTAAEEEDGVRDEDFSVATTDSA